METIWFDPAISFRHDRPLEAGAGLPFPVGPADLATQLKPQLLAVEFEDGSSAGDPQWLSKLHLRRRAAYNEIGAITTLLNQALAEHQANEQIISNLKNAKASMRNIMPDVDARVAAGLVIDTTVSNLERGGIRGSIGDPQKTIPAAILPLFAEWRGALKRYDRNIS
jgi:hypothetical protein